MLLVHLNLPRIVFAILLPTGRERADLLKKTVAPRDAGIALEKSSTLAISAQKNRARMRCGSANP